MTSPFDPSRLPGEIRADVVRALRQGEGHEVAIEALERHLDRGGERSPDVLLALAMLTYEDAATLVLNRLEEASETALALLDEACEGQLESDELRSLRAHFVRTLEREQIRGRRLRELLERPELARPTELMQLADRILLSGDDDELATELMIVAAAG